VIVVLLVLNIIVIGMVNAAGGQHDLTKRRLDTVRAFYAAEGGMHMAIREMSLSTDEDGDTGVGTISDDTNDATDPAIGDGNVAVTSATAGSETTLTSRGRSGDARRQMAAVTE
jgi:Tfp pilus assembly protein PilX